MRGEDLGCISVWIGAHGQQAQATFQVRVRRDKSLELGESRGQQRTELRQRTTRVDEGHGNSPVGGTGLPAWWVSDVSGAASPGPSSDTPADAHGSGTGSTIAALLE